MCKQGNESKPKILLQTLALSEQNMKSVKYLTANVCKRLCVHEYIYIPIDTGSATLSMTGVRPAFSAAASAGACLARIRK